MTTEEKLKRCMELFDFIDKQTINTCEDWDNDDDYNDDDDYDYDMSYNKHISDLKRSIYHADNVLCDIQDRIWHLRADLTD